MAFDPISAGSLALGGAGLFDQKKQRSKANRYQDEAASALSDERGFRNRVRSMVEGYDPSAETKEAVDYASSVASDSITKGLTDLNTRFKAAGGDPSGDTRFKVSAQGLTNRITDPLRAFVANRKSSEFNQKLQAFQVAMGAPVGQFADAYSRLSQMSMPDMSGTFGLISSGIRGLMPKKETEAGNSPMSSKPAAGGAMSPETMTMLQNLAKSLRGFGV